MYQSEEGIIMYSMKRIVLGAVALLLPFAVVAPAHAGSTSPVVARQCVSGQNPHCVRTQLVPCPRGADCIFVTRFASPRQAALSEPPCQIVSSVTTTQYLKVPGGVERRTVTTTMTQCRSFTLTFVKYGPWTFVSLMVPAAVPSFGVGGWVGPVTPLPPVVL